jgi:transcriptional regulator with XRE-family HTH domain
MENPIKRLREEQGMSQHEFGQLLGVASTTIASLELGRTKTISDKVAKAIAEVFGIAPKKIRQKYEAWLEEKRAEQLRRVRRLR